MIKSLLLKFVLPNALFQAGFSSSDEDENVSKTQPSAAASTVVVSLHSVTGVVTPSISTSVLSNACGVAGLPLIPSVSTPLSIALPVLPTVSGSVTAFSVLPEANRTFPQLPNIIDSRHVTYHILPDVRDSVVGSVPHRV